MPLPDDICRCSGGDCPSKRNCRRYMDKTVGNCSFAAFYARREAGADCCDQIIPIVSMTTYREVE